MNDRGSHDLYQQSRNLTISIFYYIQEVSSMSKIGIEQSIYATSTPSALLQTARILTEGVNVWLLRWPLSFMFELFCFEKIGKYRTG
jgi:hypothetical protein